MSNFPKRNFYEILNCSANASNEELKFNYKQLILQCHPDKLQQQQHQQEQQQEEENKQQLNDVLDNLEIKNLSNNSQFMAITEAWNCLKDPLKRKQYDAELLLNKFHTHNNIYAHITLNEMKKQYNKEDGEEFYTYDCRCGGQYIVDESAEQYFCTNNQKSHTTHNDDVVDDDIQQKLDKDSNGGVGDGDAELNTQNNKNLKNNTNNIKNNDGGGANSEGVVFLQQYYKETPAAATTPKQNLKHDNVNNEDDDDENDGDLIVECSECSLVIILNG